MEIFLDIAITVIPSIFYKFNMDSKFCYHVTKLMSMESALYVLILFTNIVHLHIISESDFLSFK